jgi:hypothetical protein
MSIASSLNTLLAFVYIVKLLCLDYANKSLSVFIPTEGLSFDSFANSSAPLPSSRRSPREFFPRILLGLTEGLVIHHTLNPTPHAVYYYIANHKTGKHGGVESPLP